MVGPNFQSPDTQFPDGWVGPTDKMSAAAEKQAVLVHWWTTFEDPMLTSLVDRAVAANLDLKSAESRIRQARATRGIAFAALFPTVTVGTSFDRSRSPGPVTSPKVNNPANNLYQIGLDASWEIDVFGGIRRGIEAADATVQASVEDRRDVLVTLAAEVALDYMDLRGFQQRVAIAQENLKNQKHSADLTRQRKQGGLVGALDVANADAQVASTAAAIPLLEAAARQSIYSLSVLLAREPGALLAELSPAAGIPPTPPEVPIALPSSLLRRRPDIRRSEAQIHAATANIGVATADLFPKFNLVGSAGFESGLFRSFMSWGSRFWSFGPSISWTLFDGGRIFSNIEVQNAVQEQTVLTYRKTVLTALQDVENALIAYSKEQETHKALVEAVAANRRAVDFSTQLYANGLTDFLSVLIAQQQLFSSEDALVQATLNLSTDLVALYKALGGGWEEEPPPAKPKQEEKPAAPAKT
jgi:NodT family efflux transporter outer membrane factor (OMF) lipoprotein